MIMRFREGKTHVAPVSSAKQKKSKKKQTAAPALSQAIDVTDPLLVEIKTEKQSIGSPRKQLERELKELRDQIAKEDKVSGVHKPDANKWLITDRALKFVSKKLPKTLAEFASVEGIGKIRAEKYGARFVFMVIQFCEKHPELEVVKADETPKEQKNSNHAKDQTITNYFSARKVDASGPQSSTVFDSSKPILAPAPPSVPTPIIKKEVPTPAKKEIPTPMAPQEQTKQTFSKPKPAVPTPAKKEIPIPIAPQVQQTKQITSRQPTTFTVPFKKPKMEVTAPLTPRVYQTQHPGEKMEVDDGKPLVLNPRAIHPQNPHQPKLLHPNASNPLKRSLLDQPTVPLPPNKRLNVGDDPKNTALRRGFSSLLDAREV